MMKFPSELSMVWQFNTRQDLLSRVGMPFHLERRPSWWTSFVFCAENLRNFPGSGRESLLTTTGSGGPERDIP
jgi:hypothetical protein